MMFLLISYPHFPEGDETTTQKEWFSSFNEAWIEFQASKEVEEEPSLWEVTGEGCRKIA